MRHADRHIQVPFSYFHFLPFQGVNIVMKNYIKKELLAEDYLDSISSQENCKENYALMGLIFITILS
jgi:hypothetical protein